MNQKEIIRNLINDTCICRVPTGSRELPSMDKKGFYTWQFYLRNAILNPVCLNTVGNDFWDKNEDNFKRKRFQIAGLESAAVPLISAIAMEAFNREIDINAFTVRKTRKEYGLRNIIEGLPTDDPVFFIDDLTSPQHNAFWQFVNVLALHKLTLYEYGYVLVLKKHNKESKEINTSIGKAYIQSMFSLDDFDLALEDYKNTEQ